MNREEQRTVFVHEDTSPSISKERLFDVIGAENGGQTEEEKVEAIEEENVGRPKIMARVTKPSKAKPIPPYSALFIFSPSNSCATHLRLRATLVRLSSFMS